MPNSFQMYDEEENPFLRGLIGGAWLVPIVLLLFVSFLANLLLYCGETKKSLGGIVEKV